MENQKDNMERYESNIQDLTGRNAELHKIILSHKEENKSLQIKLSGSIDPKKAKRLQTLN